MNAPLDFLLDQPETPTRELRGTWHQIHPATLAEQFDDPHIAIAAAVIQRALLDIRNNTNQRNARQFIQSDWFTLIARSLSFDPHTLQIAIAQMSGKVTE